MGGKMPMEVGRKHRIVKTTRHAIWFTTRTSRRWPIFGGTWSRSNSNTGAPWTCRSQDKLSLWIQFYCQPFGTLSQFGLDLRESSGELKLYSAITFGLDQIIRPEHEWVGTIARCQEKRVFSFISSKDVMKALMSKWIIQALLPGKSSLQIILKYRIMHLQPSYHGL